MIIETIGIIVIIYFLLGFVIPLIVIPNLYLIKTPVQKTEKLKKFAKKLKGKTKEKTLKKCFDYVTRTYYGKEQRWFVVTLIHKLFIQDVEKVLDKKQFLQCHIQDRVLMTLLINTRQFSEKDFERKITMSIYGIVHQYLIVKVNRKKFKVDPFYRIFEKIN